MTYLESIINNRVVFILAHGASIYELERRIEEFRDLDVCYASLNSFPMMEEFILSRIGKHLDIVFDCSTVAESRIPEFEKLRVSRLEPFLSRNEDNIWITSHGLIRDMQPYGYNWFTERFKSKILKVDSLFPSDAIPRYMKVPNSVTLLIASCIYGKAKKIFIFGLDGYNSEVEKGLNSCYHPEIVAEDRRIALGKTEDPGINRDTTLFQNNFAECYQEYTRLFGYVPLFNCSVNSVYNNIIKISYNEVREEILK